MWLFERYIWSWFSSLSVVFICDVTHWYLWLDSFHMWDMTLRVVSLKLALFFIGCFYLWRDSFICVTWLISYVGHDSSSGVFEVGSLLYRLFLFVTWLIHMCDMTHFMCVTWLFEWCLWSWLSSLSVFLIWAVTHSYVWRDSFHVCDVTLRVVSLKLALLFVGCFYLWRDSFICVTWLISYVGRDSSSGVFEVGSLLYRLFLFVTWLIHMCDMTHFICGTWLFEWCLWSWLSSLSVVFICDVTHSYVWHDSFHVCDVTLRVVSLKLALLFVGFFNLGRDSFICVTWLISHVWRDSSSGVFQIGSPLFRFF